MLRLYRSSDLYQLADFLLKELREQPLPNPFIPERFVVQNHGMARWLSLHIAEKENVAANLQFDFPAELFWQLIRLTDPGIPEALPSERLSMTWAIFHLLGNDRDAALAELHSYVRNSNPQNEEMRCWNLACRISDVFDQYLTYRPEMVLAWERGALKTKNSSERWQAALWQKLIKHWHAKENKSWHHRAKLQEQLITAMNEQSIFLKKLPSRISVFGVSEMPPVYLQTFLKLSGCTDVHFYLTNSSASGDTVLAQLLGGAGREFDKCMNQFLKNNDSINSEVIDGEEPDEETHLPLFSTLKQDLIAGRQSPYSGSVDGTIQVHSCHSARREVEVLYDQLLKLLDENVHLNPSDILVLSPQMDAYAPEIDAVFGAVEDGVPKIPFNLAESAVPSQAVYTSFMKILDLVDSRFKVTSVLDLLDYKPVRQAFLFSEEDINTLQTWIGDTRIRWGIDGSQKRALGLPKSNRYTWQSGLYRMLSGYAMETQDDLLFEDIYPYAEIQQSEQARLLGRFSEFMYHLFQCHKDTKTPKEPAEWHNLLYKWLSLFFAKEPAYTRHIQVIREIISAFNEQTDRAKFNDPVSFPVLCSYLKDRIVQKGTGGARSGQGVTFSALVPMRNIPAKVICMIGMNEGAFPRSKNAVEFDLIAQYPQAGDRGPRKDDRQIFLENILAARQRIYFSYTGQSNRKDLQFPPSIVLRELIDYIEDQYSINRDDFVQRHRIQPFSPAYFKKDVDFGLFSYSIKNQKMAHRLLQPVAEKELFLTHRLPKPDQSYKILSITELISFFQEPVKFLFQQRLGVFLRDDEILDKDREVFELNALEKYQLRQKLLNRFLEDEPLAPFQKIAFAKNLLPDGWSGQYAFVLQEAEALQFGQSVKEALIDQKNLDDIEVNCKIGDFHLAGQLNHVYSREQLFYRFGRMRPKDLMELWIKHLLFQLAKPEDHPGQSLLFALNKYKTIQQVVLPVLPDAKHILEELLEIYWTGLQEMIYFFPESSYAYAKALLEDKKSEEQAVKIAQKKWTDPNSKYLKEGDDPYNKRMMNGINFMEDKKLYRKFKHISHLVWQPFFKNMNKEKAGVK